MNRTSNIDSWNFTSLILEKFDENDLITSATITKITITTTTVRLINSTRTSSFLRSSATVSPFLKNYFIFKSPFHRIIRIIELFILSLTLPLYAIVFILFVQLSILRISRNIAISGGDTRSRTQRRQQRMRSLIWTSNYLLVDFLNLLYEVVYVIIHLTGDLQLNSLAGRFYCQLQVYVPLYLTVLMAYSLTAISIYRRRHFVNLNNQMTQTNRTSIIMISSLWLMPAITSILPAYLLTHLKILEITQHETTNQCQISYAYESNIEAIYIFYRLGNLFLLPISISLICYLTIYVDLIRMQRRFSRVFKRHVHIRKNLILQILFLFLNFAVFWLPAEIIMFYTSNRQVRDAVQVTKSLNILLDPLIITGFDTRFSSAAQQLLSKWPFEQFMCIFNSNRPPNFPIRTRPTIRERFKLSRHTVSQRMTTGATWNLADNDDITVLESVGNHAPQKQQPRPVDRRQKATKKRKIIAENHV